MEALNQFHTTNRANRQEFFYLNFMVPPTMEKTCHAKAPLDVVVEMNQQHLILHPVFQRLIEVKWKRMGRFGAISYNILNLCLCLLWTGLMVTLPKNPETLYQGERKNVVITMEIFAIASLIILLGSELREFFKARNKNECYKRYKEEQIERDLRFTHPKWPEERAYLEREIREVRNSKSSYIRDKWNYFDWVTYSLMGLTVACHVFYATYKTTFTSDFYRAIGSVMLIFLWVRMLKYARPYSMFGLFVVMLSHVVTDTFRIFFLGMHFFIPYAAAFWIIFGVFNIEGYTLTYGEIFYNLFEMIVVGDYNFEGLKSHQEIMSRLLCGTFIFFCGIICLNLFIALMSDTFQRVYDNAKANAIMQRAAIIVSLETDTFTSRLIKHREWINTNCAPECLYYDDDVTDPDANSLKKITHQINVKLSTVKEYLEDHIVHKNNNDGVTEENYKQSNTAIRKTSKMEIIQEQSFYEKLTKIEKNFERFQKEYHRSLIQTRAEIAGLGLMLKELTENHTKEALKKKKKRNQKLFNQLYDDNTLPTKLSPNALKKLPDIQAGNLRNNEVDDNLQNQSNMITSPISANQDFKCEDKGETSENFPPLRENSLELETYSKTNPTDDIQRNSDDQTLSSSSNDFFEGYTFPVDFSKNSISDTWKSIIITAANQQEAGSETSSDIDPKV